MTFSKFLDNIEDYFCVFLMLVMVMCLALQVGTRMLVGSSIAWTEELSRYSFIWCVYVGAARMARKNGHVRITAQMALIPPKARIALRMLTDSVWIFFNMLFAWQGLQVVIEGFKYPEYSATLNLLKAEIDIIIPIAFVLMSYRIVDFWLRHIKNGTIMDIANTQQEEQL